MKKRIFINLAITLLIGIILYYFMLPPLNLTAPSFWSFVIILMVIYFILSLFKNSNIKVITSKHGISIDGKAPKLIYVIVGIVVLIVLVNVIVSPFFNATLGRNMIAGE